MRTPCRSAPVFNLKQTDAGLACSGAQDMEAKEQETIRTAAEKSKYLKFREGRIYAGCGKISGEGH